MNKSMQHLMEIADKDERTIIGLMSGTSLDGLDIALCRIKGNGRSSVVNLLHFTSFPYPESVKTEIRKVFAKSAIEFQDLTLLNPWLANIHADYIMNAIADWNINSNEVDLIASHGQTVFHSPQRLHKQSSFPNATLQIVDGDHIAVKTGIITVSDFRQKHLAAGGEGAPLASYGDYLLFSKKGENRVLLNIGGIANFTYLGGDDPTAIMVTDTGPGNTLMDMVAKKYFDLPFDKGGKLASQGEVNEALLNTLKAHPFFKESFPKTTGPELFNHDYLQSAIARANAEDLSPVDLIATVTTLTAETIADSIKAVVGENKATIYASGGGADNPVLIQCIASSLPKNSSVRRTDELGIPAAAKEAILFAILANETIAGDPESFPGNNLIPSISMGKISFPA